MNNYNYDDFNLDYGFFTWDYLYLLFDRYVFLHMIIIRYEFIIIK